MVFKDQDVHRRCAHCYWGIVPKPSQWTVANICTHTSVSIHLYLLFFLYLPVYMLNVMHSHWHFQFKANNTRCILVLSPVLVTPFSASRYTYYTYLIKLPVCNHLPHPFLPFSCMDVFLSLFELWSPFPMWTPSSPHLGYPFVWMPPSLCSGSNIPLQAAFPQEC